LEECLGTVLGHRVTVRGAGRTDAGVHARGQVVSFITVNPIPAQKLPEALVRTLPPDLIVDECEEVPESFDPLRDAVRKTYCYRIWRGNFEDVFWSRYSYHHRGYLDWDLMVSEASDLLGKHDFRGFMAEGSSARTTVREVFHAGWARKENPRGEIWEFSITADGFLYKMVRLTVGTLLDVGRGRFAPGRVSKLLSGEKVERGLCVPGKGLCLEEVAFS
jgi:tRNA pseudouridine38-40 synthase